VTTLICYQYLHKKQYCNIPSTGCVCSFPLLAGCVSILLSIVVAYFVCRLRLLSSVTHVIWNGNTFVLNNITLFVRGGKSIRVFIANFLTYSASSGFFVDKLVSIDQEVLWALRTWLDFLVKTKISYLCWESRDDFSVSVGQRTNSAAQQMWAAVRLLRKH
jgi:hypothetical protein